MAYTPVSARAPMVLLRDSRPLKVLLNRARRLEQLQRLLESQLQPAAREHCRVAAWREGTLLLVVTDGHWATRLRYQQKRLQRGLQEMEAFFGLNRILFQVRPPTFAPPVPGRALDISSAAAENIQATAEGIADPKLKAALERLAKHGKKPL